MNAIVKKWIDPMTDQLTRAKYKDIAEKQAVELVNEFSQEFPEVENLIQLDKIDDRFAQLWSKLMLLTFSYNYFTCFWMIGFRNFPKSWWFCMEVIAEIATLVDFLICVILPRWQPERWKSMQLLQSSSDNKLVKQIVRGVCSFPFSLVLSSIFLHNQARLLSLGIASTRLLKLYHFRGLQRYFDANKINKSENSVAMFNLSETIYNFAMLVHTITLLFLIPVR